MSDDKLELLRSNLEQRNTKKKQLSILEKKEVEDLAKEARLRDMVKQAEQKYEYCVKANLTGDASYQELEQAKAELKELNESYSETKQRLELIPQMRGNLTNEIGTINMSVNLYRKLLATAILNDLSAEHAGNKKLNEKLCYAYGAFSFGCDGTPNWDWFLNEFFQEPKQQDLEAGIEKFRNDHSFLTQ